MLALKSSKFFLISVITPNTKPQIHKWSRNTSFITGGSMISAIDKKRLSKKISRRSSPFPLPMTFITEVPWYNGFTC